jgi:hypothetical protein
VQLLVEADAWVFTAYRHTDTAGGQRAADGRRRGPVMMQHSREIVRSLP